MIDILFNIDENYKEICKTVMRSILVNTKEDVRFHILGISNLNCNFADVKCYGKPDTSIIKAKTNFMHITTAACYRLFAPIVLKNLDKVIYLDSDVIVLDDIKKLWDIDVNYIAGVQDSLYKYQAEKNDLHHTYINTGVLVMNLKNLRKLNYIERIEKTQNGGYNLSLLDQDIINIAFEKEIELLPHNWNVLSKIYAQTTQEMLKARENPSIIHWAGHEKPWDKKTLWQAQKWFQYEVKEEKNNYKKAIVLTYAPVTDEEKELLRNTDIFKIATNFSAVDLKPDLRLTADDIVDKCLECDTCDVVSCNFDLNKDRVINGAYLPKRYTSLISCLDYLYLKGYDKILLVASNPESATHKRNYDYVNEMKEYLYLYKYTKEGCFDIPHKTVKEFIMLTDDEKILGIEENRERKLLSKLLFTDAYRFEVQTKGYNNKSNESGRSVGNVLPLEYKNKLLAGETEVEYNGLIVRRIMPEVKEPTIEEKIEEKPIVKKAVAKKKPVKKVSKK